MATEKKSLVIERNGFLPGKAILWPPVVQLVEIYSVVRPLSNKSTGILFQFNIMVIFLEITAFSPTSFEAQWNLNETY